MIKTKLSKVGNSMAVLLPKDLRTKAAIESGKELRIDSPRKGVVVITAIERDSSDRLDVFERIEERIKKRERRMKPWPDDLTAEDLLTAGKDQRSDDLVSL